MITYSRAEIRNGTGFDRGQQFVRVEDAERETRDVVFGILAAAGDRWEDAVRSVMISAGVLWECPACGWYGDYDATSCDECGTVR